VTYGSRAELEAAVAAHVPHWWRKNAGVAAELAARPGLRERLENKPTFVSTTDVYLDRGQWRPARLATQAPIIASMLGQGAPPPRPVAYYTIGPMGAGKTTRLRRIVHAHRSLQGATSESLSRICADDVRERLPEYAGGLGSLIVQAEAFLVTYDDVFPAARDAGHDLVYDTIGRVEGGVPSFASQLRELKDLGFAVHVLLADCPLDLCRARAEERALNENGRLIDAATHDILHHQPAAALKALRGEKGLLDGWATFATSRTGNSVPLVDGTDDWRVPLPSMSTDGE
jgi:hypothetical protein